jgi:hypothetical protein
VHRRNRRGWARALSAGGAHLASAGWLRDAMMLTRSERLKQSNSSSVHNTEERRKQNAPVCGS